MVEQTNGNSEVIGSIPPRNSDFFLCPTLVTNDLIFHCFKTCCPTLLVMDRVVEVIVGEEWNGKFYCSSPLCVKARLHRRFMSPQLNATQCNFCRAEVATSYDFIAILVQFVSVNVRSRLLLKQKALCLLKSETTTQSHRVS